MPVLNKVSSEQSITSIGVNGILNESMRLDSPLKPTGLSNQPQRQLGIAQLTPVMSEHPGHDSMPESILGVQLATKQSKALI